MFVLTSAMIKFGHLASAENLDFDSQVKSACIAILSWNIIRLKKKTCINIIHYNI